MVASSPMPAGHDRPCRMCGRTINLGDVCGACGELEKTRKATEDLARMGKLAAVAGAAKMIQDADEERRQRQGQTMDGHERQRLQTKARELREKLDATRVELFQLRAAVIFHILRKHSDLSESASEGSPSPESPTPEKEPTELGERVSEFFEAHKAISAEGLARLSTPEALGEFLDDVLAKSDRAVSLLMEQLGEDW